VENFLFKKDEILKDLIDSLITILEAAQTAGTLSTNKIFKGLQDVPQYVANSEFPYVMIDDGGEYTDLEPADSTRAQSRFYNVVLEVGTYAMNIETALDQVLDINNELKGILELEVNRLKDGFTWGIESTPFGWEEDRWFFRGRQIIVAYTELEDTIDKY